MTTPGPAPATIRIYSTGADLIAPLAYPKVTAKLTRLGAPQDRVCERRGEATQARPEGKLVWCHAASVGESLSILPLIGQMTCARNDLRFLITSGTQTSAKILSNRLPARTQHQFVPLDSRKYLRRFLEHWRPDAAIFVESELWPNMLRESRARGIPMALVNARISDRSVRNWKRFETSARYLLNHFEIIHCQDDRTETHLRALGVESAQRGVNLKALADPLPYDADALTSLEEKIGTRPVWLAASTHPGEDEIAIEAHREILNTHPDAVLILVPRHPERADAIDALILKAGLTATRRSKGELPKQDAAVYLADTLGEMGLWYKLCPLTLLCGSFTDVGGHNPYEPAQAGSFILHGPHYANFAHAYHDLDMSGAGQQVADAAEIAKTVQEAFASPDLLQEKQAAARTFTRETGGALESLTSSLFNALRLS
ncbi:MAG: 3-deoxy-D-manno-octulosonic acid transferase [Pseudomonadota bacterium]